MRSKIKYNCSLLLGDKINWEPTKSARIPVGKNPLESLSGNANVMPDVKQWASDFLFANFLIRIAPVSMRTMILCCSHLLRPSRWRVPAPLTRWREGQEWCPTEGREGSWARAVDDDTPFARSHFNFDWLARSLRGIVSPLFVCSSKLTPVLNKLVTRNIWCQKWDVRPLNSWNLSCQ